MNSLNKRVLEHYGEEEELLVLVEEIGELLQAVSKYKRYGLTPPIRENLAEEISHVKFCLETLQEILDNREIVSHYDLINIIRMEKRLKGDL